MKKVLFICCLFWALPMLCPFFAEAEEKKWKFDGYEWASMNRDFKLGFAFGWMRAGGIGYDIHSSFIFRSFIPRMGECGKQFALIFRSEIPNVIKEYFEDCGLEFFNVTNGQIVDTIDQIYSDPRVKQWDIEEVMPLVRGRLKGGWTKTDLDEVIAYKIKENSFWREIEERERTGKGKIDVNIIEQREMLEKTKPKVLRREPKIP